MAFSEHGRIDVKADGNIIIVDGEGPYNAEIVRAYKIKFKSLMDEICSRYSVWSQIVFVHNESIMTPEAENDLMELNKLKHKNATTILAKTKEGLSHIAQDSASRT